MQGFRDFLLKGNVVTLGVAFVMAAAFEAVITALVTVILDLIGKAGGNANFSNWTPLGGVHVGLFITAFIAFLVLSAIVYLFIIVPYTRARERYYPEEVNAPSDVELLTEIRDLLAEQRGHTTSSDDGDTR